MRTWAPAESGHSSHQHSFAANERGEILTLPGTPQTRATSVAPLATRPAGRRLIGATPSRFAPVTQRLRRYSSRTADTDQAEHMLQRALGAERTCRLHPPHRREGAEHRRTLPIPSCKRHLGCQPRSCAARFRARSQHAPAEVGQRSGGAARWRLRSQSHRSGRKSRGRHEFTFYLEQELARLKVAVQQAGPEFQAAAAPVDKVEVQNRTPASACTLRRQTAGRKLLLRRAGQAGARRCRKVRE